MFLAKKAIFLLGAIGCTFSACEEKKDPVTEALNTAENKLVKIAFTDKGKGDTALVFVHGSFINKEYWNEQVQHFSPRFRVVTIDLGGHGESGTNRDTWTLQEFGDDIVAVVDKLKLKKVVLIGHSIGGDIILEASSKNPIPVIGLIAVDFFKNAGRELPKEIQQQVSEGLTKDFSATTEAYVRQGLITASTDTTIANKVVKAYRDAQPDMGKQFILEGFAYSKRERELLGQLKWKLYLINVDYMPTNVDLLKKQAAAGYEIVPVSGTCHYPMIENPKAFNGALEKCLAKISTTK